MAATPRRILPKDKINLFDGDCIDLTDENEAQTYNPQTDDGLELVDTTKNNQESVNKTLQNQTNNTAPLKPSNAPKFIIPVVNSSIGNHYLVLSEDIIKNSSFQNINNVQQNQVTTTSGSILTKLNFKNTGGKITVEETPVIKKQSQKAIILNHVTISPNDKTTLCKNTEITSTKTTSLKNASSVSSSKETILNSTSGKTDLQKNTKRTNNHGIVIENRSVNELILKGQTPLVQNSTSKIAKTPLRSSQPAQLKLLANVKAQNNIIVLSDEETEKPKSKKSVTNEASINEKFLNLAENSLPKNYNDKINILRKNKLSLSTVKANPTSALSATKPLVKLDKNISNELFTKTLKTRWGNINSNQQTEVEASPTDVNGATSTNSAIPVEGDTDSEPLYYVVYSMDEGEKNEDNLEAPSVDTNIEPPCTVTPVSITEILNRAKKPEIEVKDRCEPAVLKKKDLYVKGFTRAERKKSSCSKTLKDIISAEEKKIAEMKKSENFIQCRSDPKNFLPETTRFEMEENDEFSMEYDKNEDAVQVENCYSTALPVIEDVISRVREELMLMKKGKKGVSKADLQKKLTKPEEGLRKIKEGLQLIKNWSKEIKTESKTKDNVVVEEKPKRRRRKKIPETTTKTERKRKTNKRDDEDFVCSPAVKKNKRNEPEVKEKVTRRTRKRKQDYDDVSDLLIVKKVDILKEKRRRR